MGHTCHVWEWFHTHMSKEESKCFITRLKDCNSLKGNQAPQGPQNVSSIPLLLLRLLPLILCHNGASLSVFYQYIYAEFSYELGNYTPSSLLWPCCIRLSTPSHSYMYYPNFLCKLTSICICSFLSLVSYEIIFLYLNSSCPPLNTCKRKVSGLDFGTFY